MKKLFMTLILALVSTSAFAQWIKVGEDDESTIYTDPSTIRKKGDLIKIWSLYDFKKAQNMSGKTYLSMEKQYEFDCVKGQSRL
ncbi:MAG: surface-adhesin E family protein, partial [Gallionella sp.]